MTFSVGTDIHEVTQHVPRYTFATLAIQKGNSLAAIQKILGHDRLAIMALYLNLTDPHVLVDLSANAAGEPGESAFVASCPNFLSNLVLV